MSLRLKINLIVASVIALLVLAMIALELDGVRKSVREEIVATNRVTVQLLHRLALQYPADLDSLVHFLQHLGRVRANNSGALLDSTISGSEASFRPLLELGCRQARAVYAVATITA